MKPSDILSLLGISQKAGKVVSGQDSVERAVNSNRVFLIIISEDASENTKKRFLNLAKRWDIPVFLWGSSDELGKSIGKGDRKILGITDKGLSLSIYKRLNLLMGVGDIE